MYRIDGCRAVNFAWNNRFKNISEGSPRTRGKWHQMKRIATAVLAMIVLLMLPLTAYAAAEQAMPAGEGLFELTYYLTQQFLYDIGISPSAGTTRAAWSQFVENVYNSFADPTKQQIQAWTNSIFNVAGHVKNGYLVDQAGVTYLIEPEGLRALVAGELSRMFSPGVNHIINDGIWYVPIDGGGKIPMIKTDLLSLCTQSMGITQPYHGNIDVDKEIIVPIDTVNAVKIGYGLDTIQQLKMTLMPLSNSVLCWFLDIWDGYDSDPWVNIYGSNAGITSPSTTEPYKFVLLNQGAQGVFLEWFRYSATDGCTYINKSTRALTEIEWSYITDAEANTGTDIDADFTPKPDDAVAVDGAPDGYLGMPLTAEQVAAIKAIIDALLAQSGTGTADLTDDYTDIQQWQEPAGIATKFPFCIPFDLANILEALNVSKEAPHWTFNLNFGPVWHWNFTLDLSQFEDEAAICRACTTVLFVICLIMATRKLIQS